jgi:hypothetical protein
MPFLLFAIGMNDLGSASTLESQPPRFSTAWRAHLPGFLLALAFVALGSRMVVVVWRHSVNLIFFDQWEFYEPLFTHASLWRIFTWQHGPHREGIELVLDKFVLDWTHWINRAEALLIVAALLTAASVAVWLKVRIFGKLEYTDAVIPCLFLTLAPIDILIGVPNPVQAVAPNRLWPRAVRPGRAILG